MIRLAALLSVFLLGMPAGRAIAGPPGPICRLPTVVEVMTRELRTRAAYVWLDPAVIEEAPTPNARVVRCGVCSITAFYDTALYGAQPVGRCEPHTFTVESLRNGYIVRSIQ